MNTATLSLSEQRLLNELVKIVNLSDVRNMHIYKAADNAGVDHSVGGSLINKSTRLRRGHFDFSHFPLETIETSATFTTVPEVVQESFDDAIQVPHRNDCFIKWGHYDDIRKIILSRQFFPIYITGLSGNGKTLMVEQVCADLDRPCLRIQLTPETDENDLIGGFRLKDGETVFQKGPVIRAMETGSILLIDEMDRATNKIMCMQSIMEGNPVFIKKINEVVYPKPGFNIIATANTKGQGSIGGKFTAANVIDEAFLERFVLTFVQPFPKKHIEKRIVTAHMKKYNYGGHVDNDFVEKLVRWSQSIRKSYEDEGVDAVVSTRRLCHIVQTNSIFDVHQR